MRRAIAKLLLCVNTLVFTTFVSIAQENIELTEHQIKAQFIYNFLELTRWPNDENIKQLTIGVLDENKTLFQQLKKITSVRTIRGKKISIRFLNKSQPEKPVHALILSPQQSRKIQTITSSLVKTGTLVISDAASDKKFIMINFNSGDTGSVKFEINKSNLIYEGLSVSDDILLYGGTEIDVASLYKEMTHALNQMKDEAIEKEAILAQYQNNLLIQNKELTQRKRQIDQAREEIKSSHTELLSKQSQVQRYKNDLVSIADELARNKIERNNTLKMHA